MKLLSNCVCIALDYSIAGLLIVAANVTSDRNNFGGIIQTQFVTSRIFIKCPSQLKPSEVAISVDFPHNSSSLSSVCFVKLLNRRLCYFSAAGNSRHHDGVYSKLFLFLGLRILFVVGASLYWRFLQVLPDRYVNVMNCLQMSCCSYRPCAIYSRI
jgi:hypothetical protein